MCEPSIYLVITYFLLIYLYMKPILIEFFMYHYNILKIDGQNHHMGYKKGRRIKGQKTYSL
jgi:hypothetical protein